MCPHLQASSAVETEDSASGSQELVPRFLPWAQQLLALLPQHLPQGCCCCPGCGPGDELILLHQALPGRRIVGIDLAPGMTQLAQQRIEAAGLRGVSVQVTPVLHQVWTWR